LIFATSQLLLIESFLLIPIYFLITLTIINSD
jgi:hypothetical protein